MTFFENIRIINRHMERLFNRAFFKFSFGFIAMILFGLLGILLTGYLEVSQETEKTPTGIMQEVLSR